MRHEFNITDAKFVYTKDELGYQEVLDRMHTAKKVAILTYNISERQTHLLKCLKQTSPNTEISIITNIPSRWEIYHANNYRELARRKIDVYLSKLKPDEIGNRVNVFFKFDNHGKIVVTDKIAYIGSSNFSEESGSNIEFGVITYDESFISFLFENLIPEIENKSLPYYEYNYFPLLLESEMAMATLHKLVNDLHEQVYLFHDDIDGRWWIYNTTEDNLAVGTCDEVISIVSELCSISADIYDAIDTITRGSDETLCLVENTRDELYESYSKIETLLLSDSVHDLANYDKNDYINELLQTEYGMEAWEENFENSVERASDTAIDELIDLAIKAETDLENAFNELKAFRKKYEKLLLLFKRLNLKKENSNIDNT